ncbi:hypothetical protein JTB14_015885 [Gonioctena quinquepunctata]|nr:hypothetical protein JTB14_015885 [Gonioctena quinquepunctata]
MIIKNSVLLLKSQTGENASDKYQELLNSNGYEVKQVKSLVFEFKNIEILREKLKNVKDYEGIIFSSPRCVKGVCMATIDEVYLNSWRTKHNFAVGEATYKEALDNLGLECKGKESGNAVNLSKVILSDKSLFSKPFLFPHGNLKTDSLQRELNKDGLEMEGVLVYDTIPNPDIKKEIVECTDNFSNIPEYVVFFSPSGLHSSINYLRKIPDFTNAKIIAIGPVTELALKEGNLTIFGVTKNPTPQDVLNIVSDSSK